MPRALRAAFGSKRRANDSLIWIFVLGSAIAALCLLCWMALASHAGPLSKIVGLGLAANGFACAGAVIAVRFSRCR